MTQLSPTLRQAVQALRRGGPVLLFDAEDREGETDLFYAASAATPAIVRELRAEAGGLVFVALGSRVRHALGLPMLDDILAAEGERSELVRALLPQALPYDARSSFSLTVNHREAFTGITDRDRAMTVRALGRIASLCDILSETDLRDRFAATFRAPGHVHLCCAADGSLAERRGHTELAVALSRLAGLPEAVVGAEILEGDLAMTPERARVLAERRAIPFVEGAELVSVWQGIQEGRSPIAAHP